MQFIKLAEVIGLTRLSKSSIYRGIRAGTFPAAIHISKRSVAWNNRDIHQWMENCKVHSD
jgi:prophage regulatory protein